MTIPNYLSKNKRAKEIFETVKKHLAESDRAEEVDAEMVAAYASAAEEYERLSLSIIDDSLTQKDHNDIERKKPEVLLRNQAFTRMAAARKDLAIDRNFREKGKEKTTGLGKAVDKMARLRKIG